MNVLVIGSGGREHAVVKALKKSLEVDTVFCCPGNGGIAKDAVCGGVDAMDAQGLLEFARENKIGFAVVTPDGPLAAGIADAFEQAGIPAFGPSKAAAEIESSKVFSKGLMKRYGIPTAAYEVFENPEDAYRYLEQCKAFPIVLKADGLALGKGAIIAGTLESARQAVQSMMVEQMFGESGRRIVIEEFLTGPEVTVLAFTDSKTVRPMVAATDHKRAHDGDEGLNTGGMGTIAPSPFYTQALAQECMETIFLPTIRAMCAEGRPFKGCLYFGLMLTPNGPKVIEYNSRFGDPETQVVLPLLETDLFEIFRAVREERLADLEIRWADKSAACVIMASGGYPEGYQKGLPVRGLDQNGGLPGFDGLLYHAGTAQKDGGFVTSGGRVLGVTALGKTLEEALKKAYVGAEKISFDGAFYRRDIGKRALEFQKREQ